jgi:hypothetical protein
MSLRGPPENIKSSTRVEEGVAEQAREKLGPQLFGADGCVEDAELVDAEAKDLEIGEYKCRTDTALPSLHKCRPRAQDTKCQASTAMMVIRTGAGLLMMTTDFLGRLIYGAFRDSSRRISSARSRCPSCRGWARVGPKSLARGIWGRGGKARVFLGLQEGGSRNKVVASFYLV